MLTIRQLWIRLSLHFSIEDTHFKAQHDNILQKTLFSLCKTCLLSVKSLLMNKLGSIFLLWVHITDMQNSLQVLLIREFITLPVTIKHMCNVVKNINAQNFMHLNMNKVWWTFENNWILCFSFHQNFLVRLQRIWNAKKK